MSQLPSNGEELHSTVIDFATPLIPSLISMHEADVLYCNQIMEFVFLLYSYDNLGGRTGILQIKRKMAELGSELFYITSSRMTNNLYELWKEKRRI